MDDSALRQSQDNFMQALDLLVRNCVSIQKATPDERKMSSPAQWVDSWCVVRAGGHRRSGHTLAPMLVATKHFDNPLFVAFSEVGVERMTDTLREIEEGKIRGASTVGTRRNCPECGHQRDAEVKAAIVSSWNLENHMRGRTYDCIVVDEASHVIGSGEGKIPYQKLLAISSICVMGSLKPFCLMLVH